MTMTRTVLPELLDGLDAQDPRARRSRRDLQRLHRVMGTQTILLDALRKMPLPRANTQAAPPLQVLEIGAGDGKLMSGVARALQGAWPAVSLTLLDRYHLLESSTESNYASAGWDVTARLGDALDSANLDPVLGPTPSTTRWDLIVANLFLHHFEDPQLSLLLSAVAARTDYFLACEPQRAWLAWAGSHLVGAVGAGAVTREDAVLSVRAGFRNKELGSLWPGAHRDWTLAEYPAGLFSHCFCAARTDRIHAGAGP